MTWLRTDEAALAAGVSERTIYRWINTGLPAQQIDDAWHVDSEALRMWKIVRATRRGLGTLRGT